MSERKIKVLVVDDSPLFREVLSRGLSKDPMIVIVATARDPFDARDKIVTFEPDVMICDVEMPRMNGIEFIRKLIPQYPLPVIVVSSVGSAVFDALGAGAVEFVAKPGTGSAKHFEQFISELLQKIKIASYSKVLPNDQDKGIKRINDHIHASTHQKMIAIGASTGGTEATLQILKYLPSNLPGIMIVQHIPPGFSRMFAERLNASTDLCVKEAESGDFVQDGWALVCPGNKHMVLRQSGCRYRVECFEGDRVNGHCPSVDVLFESVARTAGSHALGIILTGMGYDGANGLLSIRKAGGKTIGQDEQSSVVYGMPRVAYNIGAVQKQASPSQIPQLIYSWLTHG